MCPAVLASAPGWEYSRHVCRVRDLRPGAGDPGRGSPRRRDHQVHRDFVDFVVDGRPLLYRLSDLDAVSPLASDVPPSLFTAQVRALLLETGAPLPGGRYVVYGCPECEDLACGAVTAVIERDGEDVIWRDFAWQTAEDPDLERDGYHGMGPFRFRGPEYRAALSALLDGALPGSRRRVLLIGARAAPLARPQRCAPSASAPTSPRAPTVFPPTNCARTTRCCSAGRFPRANATPCAVPWPTPGPRCPASTRSPRRTAAGRPDRTGPGGRPGRPPAPHRPHRDRLHCGVRGRIGLLGAAHRPPDRPSLPRPQPGPLRRGPRTGPAPRPAGRPGGQGGGVRRGAHRGNRAGRGGPPLTAPSGSGVRGRP